MGCTLELPSHGPRVWASLFVSATFDSLPNSMLLIHLCLKAWCPTSYIFPLWLWSQSGYRLGYSQHDYSHSRHKTFLFNPISVLSLEDAQLVKVVKVLHAHPSTPSLSSSMTSVVLPCWQHWLGLYQVYCVEPSHAAFSLVSLSLHVSICPHFHSRFTMAQAPVLQEFFLSYPHFFFTHATEILLVWLLKWNYKFEKSFLSLALFS